MVRTRIFEERTGDLFKEGLVKGTAHSYVGEEAIAAAVCASLRPDDYVGSNHRGHGHCIAKGADLARMMAELMGRRDGYCGGLGGSMHIADLDLGILGANGIVGATMPLAVGAGLAAQLKKSGQVAVAFLGDGAANQGVFHESMNLAAVWNLPVVFVCENNQYALTTPSRKSTAGASIASRATAYGMPGVQVDGNDPEDVYFAFEEAVERARAGKGPSLIEALTYRWGQHSMRANLRDPRPTEELKSWLERDPIKYVEGQLISRRIMTAPAVEGLKESIKVEVEQAIEFGKASGLPTADQALSAVYSPHHAVVEPSSPGTRTLSFVEAICEALHQEMEQDDNVLVMGEDIGATGGLFQVTKGLHERFGEERVRDTPISEATFVGCGVGAAIAGLRPVVELQIFDFVALTMDMLVNQAAKFRFMLGGKPKVPLVVRGPQGGGVRLAAQHSQSLEAWFAHVPGLVVIGPSTPYDAKGLLISAIRDDNPVVFLESKLLYVSSNGPVPEQPYSIPIGKGQVKREGADVTVVATMAMVPRALTAAAQLAQEGISIEVVDPRTLRPLDEDLILSSVRKTHRLLVVQEAWTRFGFGAEVTALVVEKAFDWLDAPILRVGAPDMPMPFNDELERWAIPTPERIAEAVREVLFRA
ncbi:MAG: dehydrogenase E1 component subunit alpha/beta [Bradyrhizobiaceae bacterium]|nr:dehydrogenase E1 component subunit alpha/beta [Bradyrhizobiaceae bacterium]